MCIADEHIFYLCRVLSVKNYYPKTRIIIQILQSHNKVLGYMRIFSPFLIESLNCHEPDY